MADFENDYLIDGKSLYSLRVIDLKEVLTKRDVPYKKNATKAQLQALVIQYLNEANEEKSSEDTIQSEETNESIGGANDIPKSDDINNEQNLCPQQTEATDLSQDAGITSSVSFGDKHSIKLTIKLQPNESPNRQLSPKKSPVKEMRSPGVDSFNAVSDAVRSPVRSPVKSPAMDSHIKSPKQTPEVIKQVLPEVVTEIPAPVEPKSVPFAEVREQTAPAVVSEVLAQQDIVSSEKPKQIIEEIVKPSHQGKDADSSRTKNSSPNDSTDSTQKSTELVTKSQELPEDNSAISKDTSSDSTIKETPVVNPVKERRTVSPVKETRVVSPIKETRNRSPVKERRSVSPVKETPVVSPIKETRTVSPVKETPAVSSIKESSVVEPIVKQTDKKTERLDEKESKVPETDQRRKSPEKARPPRRRRWGGAVTNETQQNTPKGISSDQIKEMISDLDSMSATSGADSASKVSKSDTSIVVTSSLSRTQTTAATNEMPAKRDIRVVRKSVSVPEDEQIPKESVKPPVSQPVVEHKKPIVAEVVERKSEEQLDEKRESSPAKNTATEVVFIRNLVRPFTLLQLKEEDKKKTKKIQEKNHWGSTPTPSGDGSNWRSWAIPVGFALLATFIYRFYLHYSS
ncbi:unnamed protein product [Medioppia subpectinata]|uniref:HeH/LEM domain-containing protein n=1 Tax=Medioppia subpectinata TaxID=1979941 RepID=A0A7R9PYD6_9ACAR|nr:unnamed protein product [Medioppia subpectinata]CAG2105782.1 unnamed protein product [Medioppia subpectinata]